MGDQELENLEHILIDENANPIPLSYQLLQRITNNFSTDREIGSGGFGIVYKGILRKGKLVAVKKLISCGIPDETSEKQFQRELLNLMKVKHKNIVRILGYCFDTLKEVVSYNGGHVLAGNLHRFLCLEYIPNKSLEEYLKDASRGREWDMTFQLIMQICCGLQHLHNEGRINHLYLKPENILLDGMVPKIADFGLSRCFEGEKSRTFTGNLHGTLGYIAPEHIDKGEISFKSDIYSLGVIIRKLLNGSNDLSGFEEWSQNSLVTDNNPQLKRCIEISQCCMDADQHKRPTADEIVGWLNEMETVNQMVHPGFGHTSNNHSGPSSSSSSSRQEQVNSASVQPQRETSWPEWVGMPATENQMVRPGFGHSSNNNSGPSSSRQEQVNSAGSVQPQRKTSWPEWVGKPATEAFWQIYIDCFPEAAPEVHPLGSHILPGFNPKRVLIFIDEHGAVLKTPSIG